jgi:hypothetical protein
LNPAVTFYCGMDTKVFSSQHLNQHIMKSVARILLSLSVFAVLYTSCSKGDGDDPPTDPCAGVTVTVTGSTSSATTGESNGSISASASGGSSFTYSLNNGSFQSSGTFNNLAAGTYTIVAKNSNGCTGSAQFTVSTGSSTSNPCTGTPGPLFTAVKNIIQANCVTCHFSGNTQGIPNFQVDCNIVNAKNNIKTRAVDQAGTASQMPQPPNPALPTADRQKITDWVNAGGTITN